ncbi:MAG: acetolactate synthase small subunit [Anaerolineae bacterium]|nr:acetolactate synthase small subunit [Anaerolineae bacterium]
MQQTFMVYVEDKPGVLNRVASLFRRRSFNIESLTVGHTETPGVSRMTVVMDTDDMTARRVEANLYKLVNVLRVENIAHKRSVIRDLVLLKVRATFETRPQIFQIVEVFQGRVVDVTGETVIIEVTGTEEKIDSAIEVLNPYGIIEMVRTGMVAMGCGDDTPSVNPEFVHASAVAPGPVQ